VYVLLFHGFRLNQQSAFSNQRSAKAGAFTAKDAKDAKEEKRIQGKNSERRIQRKNSRMNRQIISCPIPFASFASFAVRAFADR
jgi:hypothetical protein